MVTYITVEIHKVFFKSDMLANYTGERVPVLDQETHMIMYDLGIIFTFEKTNSMKCKNST